MSFVVLGLGTALPDQQIEQGRAAALTSLLSGHDDAQTRRLAALYRRSGVQTRHAALLDRLDLDAPPAAATADATDHGPTTRARMEHYEAAVAPLALAASSRALEASGLDPAAITHLITVSCTGFHAPGFDLDLVRGLHLNPGVARTHIGFMGCHGALNGLRVARAYAGESSARVLLCAAELCSLHFRFGWDAEQAVSNALFGDGAAALVGSGDRGKGGADPAWRLVANGSQVVPATAEAMSWRIGDHGFTMTLSPQVALQIQMHLKPWLTAWLARYDLAVSDVGSWAVHPGGPRILDAVEQGLDLPSTALAESRRVLAECGNMSSPTVLFILDRLRRANAARPCVALGFGPGLAIEAALWQ